jgi:hypothetical protein
MKDTGPDVSEGEKTMNVREKDQFRINVLLAVYRKIGVGPRSHGELLTIAHEQASALGGTIEDAEEALHFWEQRGCFKDQTFGWGGSLSAKGADIAEDFLRQVEAGEEIKPQKRIGF